MLTTSIHKWKVKGAWEQRIRHFTEEELQQ